MKDDDLRAALAHALCDELNAAHERIMHCIDQLSDEQIWWRPPNGLNAIGNLLLHLTGNVKQVIADNLTGAGDTRDRPAEFAARGVTSRAILLNNLAAAVRAASEAISRASAERFVEVVRVNKNEWTGVQAAVRSVAHFRGHTQEIVHTTREILGEAYQFAGPK
jgi:hypothetical protein